MDQAGGAFAIANAGQDSEPGTEGGVPTLVSGSAAGGRAPGGLTPNFLMVSYSTLAIWSGQEGRNYLMIDELSPKCRLSKEVSYAPPARSDHTGLSSLCATLFTPRLAPCASLTLGGNSHPRSSHRDGRRAGHGVGDGVPLHELSSGPEPGLGVGPPGQSDTARAVPHGLCAPRGDDRPGSRRHGGTPVRAQDQGQGVLSRGGALDHEACHPLLGPEVGVEEALGPGALEPAGVGVARFDRALLAREAARPTTAQNQRRLGAADDETGPPLATGAPVGVGRRWGLCRRGARVILRQTHGRHGVAVAVGCCAVS